MTVLKIWYCSGTDRKRAMIIRWYNYYQTNPVVPRSISNQVDRSSPNSFRHILSCRVREVGWCFYWTEMCRLKAILTKYYSLHHVNRQKTNQKIYVVSLLIRNIIFLVQRPLGRILSSKRQKENRRGPTVYISELRTAFFIPQEYISHSSPSNDCQSLKQPHQKIINFQDYSQNCILQFQNRLLLQRN